MQEKQIKIDGLTINYKIIGDGNIPIILLHGWGINSNKYIGTIDQMILRAEDFGLKITITIPDLPGFGKSDYPQEAWGVDGYTDFVKKFADALNFKKFVLIGHSFGGRIAIKFSVKYPERLEALIMTGAAGIKHSPTITQKIFFVLAKVGKIIFSLPLVSQLEEPAKKILYKAAREKDYNQVRGVMRETFKKVISEDLSPCLEKVSASGKKIPVLLIWGAKDRSTPLSDGKFMQMKIKSSGGRSRLEIIDEAKHGLPYQIPEKFAKITMEFIKKLYD